MPARTDKTDPRVPIMLDKERHLLLTFRGMMAFKKATGKDLRDDKVIKVLAKGAEIEDMEALLWACLLHEDRDLKLEDVGFMIHTKNMFDVLKALNEMFTIAVPEPEEDKAPLV